MRIQNGTGSGAEFQNNNTDKQNTTAGMQNRPLGTTELRNNAYRTKNCIMA